MKKILLAMFTLAAGISLTVSNLYAFPVMGTVDPGFSSGYVLNTDTTGTATYYFKNLTSSSDLTVTKLNLTFEGDVFDLSNTALAAGSQNSGWTVSTFDLIDGYEIEMFAGPGVAEGKALIFQVNYTLLDDALALDSRWDEGGYWVQGFGVEYAELPGLDFGGGSTAPIPEPGTMVMLGISILSLAGYGKMRLKK